MNRPEQWHLAPEQTTPDIYAAHVTIAPGTTSEACLTQWSICYTLSGQCRWKNVAEEMLVTAGDVIVTYPRSWSSWRIPRREPEQRPMGDGAGHAGWETAYAVFHPRSHWYPWLESLDFDNGLAWLRFGADKAHDVRDAFLSLAQAYGAGGVLRDELTLHALEYVLLKLRGHTARREIAQDSRVRDAVEYIDSRFADSLTLGSIAAAAGLSVSHLSALFTAAMGMTPTQYVERVRLERAAETRRFGTTKIQDVAAAAGYAAPHYFSSRFRLRYGASPADYRRANRTIADTER